LAEVKPIQATGKRKTSVARITMTPGTGVITVNKRALSNYFQRESDCTLIQEPFEAVSMKERFDVIVQTKGGGTSGQAGAVRHGISRALEKVDPELRGALKKKGFLTRDARKKERKKYGQKGARARFQFSKR
jgi:small subunit ribosomal protein S9